jgi:hypothetical protein
MEILKIGLADFCADQTTVAVTATAKEKEITFYVQTVDQMYRPSLGCWITTDESRGEHIDTQEYEEAGFNLAEIVEKAEDYIQYRVIERAMEVRTKEGQEIYFLYKSSGIDVVTKNPRFINKNESSYKRKFSEPLGTFEDKDGAFDFLSDYFGIKNI